MFSPEPMRLMEAALRSVLESREAPEGLRTLASNALASVEAAEANSIAAADEIAATAARYGGNEFTFDDLPLVEVGTDGLRIAAWVHAVSPVERCD